MLQTHDLLRIKEGTWKQPADIGRYQIDFIMTKVRFRKSVRNANSYPAAGVGSDHNPVVATVCITLKKVQKAIKPGSVGTQKLKDATLAMEYRCEIDKAAKAGGQDGKGINNRRETLKNIVTAVGLPR